MNGDQKLNLEEEDEDVVIQEQDIQIDLEIVDHSKT